MLVHLYHATTGKKVCLPTIMCSTIIKYANSAMVSHPLSHVSAGITFWSDASQEWSTYWCKDSECHCHQEVLRWEFVQFNFWNHCIYLCWPLLLLSACIWRIRRRRYTSSSCCWDSQSKILWRKSWFSWRLFGLPLSRDERNHQECSEKHHLSHYLLLQVRWYSPPSLTTSFSSNCHCLA